LGPSVAGKFSAIIVFFFLSDSEGHIPGFTNNIFPANSLDTFSVFANVGLILFMFIVGLELNIKLMKKNWYRVEIHVRLRLKENISDH